MEKVLEEEDLFFERVLRDGRRRPNAEIDRVVKGRDGEHGTEGVGDTLGLDLGPEGEKEETSLCLGLCDERLDGGIKAKVDGRVGSRERGAQLQAEEVWFVLDREAERYQGLVDVCDVRLDRCRLLDVVLKHLVERVCGLEACAHRDEPLVVGELDQELHLGPSSVPIRAVAVAAAQTRPKTRPPFCFGPFPLLLLSVCFVCCLLIELSCLLSLSFHPRIKHSLILSLHLLITNSIPHHHTPLILSLHLLITNSIPHHHTP